MKNPSAIWSPQDIELAAQLARAGNTASLIELLDGRSADVVDSKGDSLLMLAAYHGNAKTVRALVAQGADAWRRNARGLSPLDGAAFKGDPEVLDVLLTLGVEANEQAPDGRTALMWAAAFNRVSSIRVLLLHGARVDLRDAAGNRAEDHAVSMQAHDALLAIRSETHEMVGWHSLAASATDRLA